MRRYEGRPQDQATAATRPEGPSEAERQSQEGRKIEITAALLYGEMLAHARTLLFDGGKLLTVNAFNGTEWTEVVHKEIDEEFYLSKARNTNQLLLVGECQLSSWLYIIRDGGFNPVDGIFKEHAYHLYEMDDGFHQLSDYHINHIKSRHVNGKWAHARVPASHCCITHSLDDDNMYMLVINKAELVSSLIYSTNVRVVGHVGYDSCMTTAVVVGGIMHTYDANYGRITCYDPRLSHSGTTVFAIENYDTKLYRHSIFLNDHIFVRTCIEGKVDMVDLRNSAVYTLPSLPRGASSHEELGVY